MAQGRTIGRPDGKRRGTPRKPPLLSPFPPVERVIVVRNDSRDRTIERAEAADAIPFDAVRIAATRLALAALLVLLLVDLARAGHVAAFALGYPYGLDYGEGIVWQQMINIVAGRGYAPISAFPTIVYHYPPVFHLASAGLAALTGIDGLLAGRLVSLLSTMAMLGLVAVLAARTVPREEPPAVRFGVAMFAALLLASSYPVVKWAAMMRVDMLEIALTLAGLLCAIHAARRPWMVIPAAIAFVLAIYTKQTAIAGPAAAFAGLMLVRPRAALSLAGLCLLLGGAALGWLSWATEGGFLRHILLYNINRIDLAGWRELLLQFGLLTGLIVAASVGAWSMAGWTLAGDHATLRARIAGDPTRTATLILLVFTLIRTLLLATMLKSGSSTNYMTEWLCGAAIFAAAALRPALHFAICGRGQLGWTAGLLLVVALPLQAWLLPSSAPRLQQALDREPATAELVARIRGSTRPVISDDMVLLLRAGKPVLWEPAIAAELAHRGLYDERLFATLVRERRFGFFVTEGNRGDARYDGRHDPLVADAIDAAYPHTSNIAGMVVHDSGGQP